MADTSRIEELRRRVQRDPASIAFAQLAEEYRRAGRYQEAIETCEGGLAHHPGYLSARVTLGRSYLETHELDAAQLELKQVLRAAPENLAALRGLAEIHHRRGELHEALAHYQAALEFAKNDPELQHLVEQISHELEPKVSAPVVVDGLSFEEVKDAFLSLEAASAGVEPAVVQMPAEAEPEATVAPEPAEGAKPSPVDVVTAAEAPVEAPTQSPADVPPEAPAEEPLAAAEEAFSWSLAASDNLPVIHFVDEDAATAERAVPAEPAAVAEDVPMEAAPPAVLAVPSGNGEATGQVEALERWLDAIIAERQRRA